MSRVDGFEARVVYSMLVKRITRLTLAMCGGLACVAAPHDLQATAGRPTANVLVLYSNGRLLPANVNFDRGLRSVGTSRQGRPVEVSDEFLDTPRFAGAAHAEAFARYLAEKYKAWPPDVVVAAGSDAMRFMLGSRDALFPGTPLVYAALSSAEIRALGVLPAGTVGVPMDLDIARTIGQALDWHPRARRLAIVTGTSEWDRSFESLMRVEVARFRGRVTPEFFAGLPTPVLLDRLARLDDGWIVFTPGYFIDGDGRRFLPRDAVAGLVGAARAPVYGPFDTFLGLGIVGGYMTSFETTGRATAELVHRLLGGAAPSSVPPPAAGTNVLNVDWRQIRRWGIDESRIPRGTIVQFKPPGLFEAYRNQVLGAVAVFLLQAGLIASLLVERRRRHRAEQTVQTSRAELAHASRLAVAGELTAALAHEINQPLGAILSNADAAEMILESEADRRDLLRRIIADIRRDDVRASEVIERLRALLRKQEVDHRPFDLNQAVADVQLVLRAEAARRRVALHVRPAATPVLLVADRVQVLQVLINLVVNAMDAIADAPDDHRVVTVSIDPASDRVRMSVRDRGRGIAPEHLEKVFESFFSTKRTGMGLGLSITRTLVEAHGGRVWAGNDPAGGAVFHVELPVAGTAAGRLPRA